VSIIVIGLWLLYQRSMKLVAVERPVAEVREFAYAQGPAALKLVVPQRHDHEHDHVHGPGGHTHVPAAGPITMGSLVALGASGGIVPCPSALVLLLSAISIGRVGLGLALLVSFSLGLAGVLMFIGLAVLYAKHLMPKTENAVRHPLVKLIPVLSAGAITVIGLAMTGVALGWVKIPGV
jgi:ABC-type nickel/cobalt efflux system permease component RcnA